MEANEVIDGGVSHEQFDCRFRRVTMNLWYSDQRRFRIGVVEQPYRITSDNGTATVANQLITPAGMEPSIRDHLTPDQCVALWVDLMDANEELLLAGLAREIGPDGDLREAYRTWYAGQMEEHDRATRQMAENLYRRGLRHGR